MDSIPMLPVWAILMIPLASAAVITLFLLRFERAAALVGTGASALALVLALSLPFMTLSARDHRAASGPVERLPEQIGPRGVPTGNLYLYRRGSELGDGIRRQRSTFSWVLVPPQRDEVDGAPLPLGVPPGVEAAGLDIRFGVSLDDLAYLMILLVTGIGFLVHVFSLGSMQGVGGRGRFHASLSLLSFAMLGVVTAPNLFQAFGAWELLGVAAYLLVGHHLARRDAAEAAGKTFMTHRVADFALLMGILSLFFAVGTVDFHQLGNLAARAPGFFGGAGAASGAWAATAIGALLFLGCLGKSAQFPLHVWLPDAVTAPPPASALISSVTVLAAGLYLVLRSYPVFSDGALQFMAWVGAITALLAGLIAIVQTDLRRVLAYAAISQVGLMVLAVGCSGYAVQATIHPEVTVSGFRSQCFTAGTFHLTTHAFFMTLLVLCAGAVAAGTRRRQDLRELGGLFHRMPWTAVAFASGSLALVGIYPFAGFWSRDMILQLLEQASTPLFGIAFVVVFCNAFALARVWFLAFTGEPRSEQAEHARDVGPTMLAPLYVLTFFAVVAGLAGHHGLPFLESHGMTGFCPGTIADFVHHGAPWAPELSWMVGVKSTVVVLFAFGCALVIYGVGAVSPETMRESLLPLHALLERRFYVDDVALFLVHKVQDTVAEILDLLEQHLLFGVGVQGFAGLWRWLGTGLGYYQTGNVRHYAILLLVGTIALLYLVTRSTTGLGG